MAHLLPLMFLFLLVPTTAGATTLDSALAEMFDRDDAGLRLLRDNGAKLGPLLTLERLPSGSYAAEVAVEIEGAVARYPLKLRREAGAWTLQWQPTGVYVSALLAMFKNDALPRVAPTAPWAEVERLPAMPIIATQKRYVTPFGEVALDDRGDQPTQGDLELSPGLASAAQKWIKNVLDDDPAPAGIDLLLDGSMSWEATNKVLFNASTVGLYQVTIVTSGAGAFQVASPVRKANFAIVLYRIETQYGLRVATSKGVVQREACAPEMTACASGPDGLAQLMSDLETPVAPVLFGATGQVTTLEVLQFAREFAAIAGIGAHQLLLGYVQK